MKKIFYMFVMLLAATAGACLQTACEDYESVDTNVHVGDILFSDYTTMNIDRYVLDSFSQVTRTPIGVVFAEPTATRPMLAVLLKEPDLSRCQFSDSLGQSIGANTALDSCNGKANTVAMYDSKLSPLADELFRFQGGSSAYIPSVAEMRLLVANIGKVNTVINELGGDIVNMGTDCWYWTSTEVEGNEGNQAWTCSAVNGALQPTPKDEVHRCRAIVEVNR